MMQAACQYKVNGARRRAWWRVVSFKGEEKGVAAIEFALVGPLFFLLIAGMFEVSAFMLAQALLEGGVARAAQYGSTGRSVDGVSREESIRAIVERYGAGLIEGDRLQLTAKSYASFSAIGAPESFTDTDGDGEHDEGEPFDDVNGNGEWDADQGRAGNGNAGEVVFYEVTYDWPLMIPYFQKLIGESNILQLSATTAVRNESWPGS